MTIYASYKGFCNKINYFNENCSSLLLLRMFRSFDDKNSSIDKEFKNSNLKIRQFQEALETFIDGHKQNNSSVFP